MTYLQIAGMTLAGILVLGCRSATRTGADSGGPDSTPGNEQTMSGGDTIRVAGTVRSVNVEGGCWRFDTSDGKQFELSRAGAPTDLLVDGKKATLILRPRPDLMSTCMIGPIAEIVRVEP